MKHSIEITVDLVVDLVDNKMEQLGVNLDIDDVETIRDILQELLEDKTGV